MSAIRSLLFNKINFGLRNVWCTPPLLRPFHSSAFVEKGRRTGSKALEPRPRALSKKQLKRKAAAATKRLVETDKRAEKIKSDFMAKQLQSASIEDYITKTDARLEQALVSELLPDGIRLRVDQSAANSAHYINPHEHYQYLQSIITDVDLAASSADAKINSLPSVKNAIASVGSTALMLSDDAAKRELQLKSNEALLNLVNEATRSVSKDSELFEKAKDMCVMMQSLKLSVHDHNYGQLIQLATRAKQFDEAERLFGEVIKHNEFAGVKAWAAKIDCLARSDRLPEAVRTLDYLIKLGVKGSPHMYVAILRAYVDQHHLKEADEFWMRMHDDGVTLTANAFSAMMLKCSKSYEPERAFFLYDEMRAVDTEPNEELFVNLIEASGTAPVWVNGYQDTVFDALALLEGKEFVPTANIYNSIIGAFAKAGDSVAAEFYFWEMRRKGLLPNHDTYAALLDAYATAQLVNIKKHGIKGRYVRPDVKLSEYHKAYLKIGAVRAAEIMSEGVGAEIEVTKRTRARSTWSDMADDDSDEDSNIVDRVFAEAAVVDDLAMKHLSAEERSAQQKKISAGHSKKQALSAPGRGQKLLGVASDGEEEKDVDEDDDEDDEGLEAMLQSMGLSDGSEVEQPQATSDDDEEGDANEEINSLIKSIGGGGRTRRRRKAERSDRPSGVERESKWLKEFESDEGEELDMDAMVAEDPELQAIMDQFNQDEPELMATLMGERKDGNVVAKEKQEIATRNKSLTQRDLEEQEEEEEEEDVFVNGYDTSQRSDPKKELAHALALLQNTDLSFIDPFAHMESTKGHVVASYKSGLIRRAEAGEAMVPAERTELAMLLDGTTDDKHHLMVDEKKAHLPTEEFPDDFGEYSWDLIEFGRAPNPDHTQPRREFHVQNIRRAELAFADMEKQGIEATSLLLTRLMNVYAAGNRPEKALKAYQEFEKRGLQPLASTYRALVRMHVVSKDIPSALAMKEEMFTKLGVADATSYGLIIKCLTSKNLVVDALQLLEESTTRNVKIKEYHLKVLRERCNSLGVSHEDLGDDPKEWVKEIHALRVRKRMSSKKLINHVSSKMR